MTKLRSILAAVLLTGTALPAHALPYGVQGTVGPAGAPARTCAGVPSCVVAGPTDAWEAAIEAAAPGAVVLLQAGTYDPNGSLVVPGNVLVANLAGSSVTITGPVSMGASNARLEGVTVRIGTEAGFGGISVQSTGAAAPLKSGVVLAHLDVAGATGETIRVRGNVSGFVLRDSIIDGQNVSGHAMKVLCDDNSNVLGGSCNFLPDVAITNNRFTRSGAAAGEDLLQLDGAGDASVTSNEFSGNAAGEDCVDWKPQGAPGTSIAIAHNVVGPCRIEGLLMHQGQLTGSTVIEGNRFDDSTLLRLVHAGTRVINNWFAAGTLTVSASNFTVGHNTFTGNLKRGDTSQGAPQNVEFINNIFSGTAFSCSSVGCGTTPSTRNVMHNTSGSFPCSSCFTADPQLSGHTIAEGSPARDMASTAFVVAQDIEGTSRPQGSLADIGAFEVASEPPPPPDPTATLSASPTEIPAGGASTLTWGSTDAATCDGTNFSTGGATAGSTSVSPPITTTYGVDCGGALANATVTVLDEPPPPDDVTPPDVAIIAPPDGATVPRRQFTRIMIDASDDGSGVDAVVLRIEGVVVATFSGAGGHDFDWKPAGKRNRQAVIEATATDLAGNSASDTITVTVAN